MHEQDGTRAQEFAPVARRLALLAQDLGGFPGARRGGPAEQVVRGKGKGVVCMPDARVPAFGEAPWR